LKNWLPKLSPCTLVFWQSGGRGLLQSWMYSHHCSWANALL
jgi:hypothetical protein